MIPNFEKSDERNDMSSDSNAKTNHLNRELDKSNGSSVELSLYLNGENNENLNISNSMNFIDKNGESINTSEDLSFHENESPAKSPDIFDDTSPKNISRYGRARKQKVITDIYVVDSKSNLQKSKEDKTPIKSSQPKVKTPNGKKSPEKNYKSFNSSVDNFEILSSANKSQMKVYVRKDLIQNKEETESLMRNMFSPAKNGSTSSTESTPEKSDQSSSHCPLDKIVLKKSPKGVFECTSIKSEPVRTILNFECESDSSADKFKSSDNRIVHEDELACGWTTGQLAWARVGGHPFWPCLTTRDPTTNRFVRQKHIGRGAIPSFFLHVTFFGDCGRRSWISKNLLMPFLGLEDFIMLKEGLTPELRKKDPKYCISFDIKLGKEGKWSAAVDEAELYLRRPIDMREEILNNSLAIPQKVKRPQKERKKNLSLSSSIFDSLFTSDNSQCDDSSDKNLMDYSDSNSFKVKKPRKKKSLKKGQTQLDMWVVKDTPEKSDQETKFSFKNECLEVEDKKLFESSQLNGENSPSVFENIKKPLNEASEKSNDSENESSHSEDLSHVVKSESETKKELENDEDKCLPRKTRKSCEINGISNMESSTPIRKRQKKDISKVKENSDEDDEHSSSDSSKKTTSQMNGGHIAANNPKYQDVEFLQFYELKRDAFMDENPDLEESDILAYLYKIWQYGESQMLDEMKSNSVCLVKGMVDDVNITQKEKRVRRAQNDENYASSSPISHREKTVRKNKIKSYFSYNDLDSSETEDEFSSDPKPIKSIKLEKPTDITKSVTELDQKENLDETLENLDIYMEALKKPKPNIFKGLLKEKVCEICEYPSNLIKCRGLCQGMFHADCVQLQKEPSQFADTSISRKKKKRGRAKGWNIKKNESNNVDCSVDNDNDTLSTSIDCNASESIIKTTEETDINGEVDIPTNSSDNGEIKKEDAKEDELQFISLDDFDDFEAKMTEKVTEMMPNHNSIEIDLESDFSDDCDWESMKPGECLIVDSKYSRMRVKKSTSPRDAEELFKCNNCVKYELPLCFVCKSDVQPKTGSDVRQRCSIIHCHHFYHPECLKAWPQTKYSAGGLVKSNKNVNMEAISCPLHVCHTCVSDDPQGCKTRFSGVKLARCVRCPATYHSFTQCVPAGTTLITASQIVCPRHCDNKSGKTPYHVNTAWCFICAKGGTLVCCETCPTSFHAECLNVPLPEGGYICEDCETGRLPLYGELVWVKLGQYRWWPALVLHPCEIPININSLPHLPGQFAVRFFGMYDHFWVNSGRVFPYQEGDTGSVSSKKSVVDNAFLAALEQAQQAYAIIKGIKSKGSDDEELISSLLPPKYVKLKINRPIGNAVVGSKASLESGASKCDCNPNSENPCSPDSDCLNRMLLTECSPSVCAAGERCGNQAFEKRLYPPLEPSRTSFRGWGLKTLADIKKGEFVIEYVGEVINEEEFQRRMQRRQEMRDENYYFLTLDKDRMIDAGPKGNVARFMNHSCEPNCETQKWTVNGDVRVGLFALKDIPAGSEVTFNYNLECAGDDKKKCLCGTKRCAGYIGAKPLQEEPLPKRPKRILLKRKYRRKKLNAAARQVPQAKKLYKKRGRPIKNPMNSPSKLQGIERDLEIINQSLLDYSNDECEKDFKEEKVITGNYDLDESFVDNTDDEVKTENKYSYNGLEDDKKSVKKRKRSFTKTQSQNKSNLINSSPVNQNKRTRSNSVQFNNSVTLIDENDVVTIINDEQNSNESFTVLKLNGDIDYDVREVSYVVNESTI